MKKQFQSLTEKGRWLIATLTLLFTLGIGQMWAKDYSSLNYNGESTLPSGYKYYGSSTGVESPSSFSTTTCDNVTVFDVTAGGSGAYNKRCIEFTITEDCSVEVKLHTGNNGRVFRMYNGSSTVVKDITLTSKGQEYTFTYDFTGATTQSPKIYSFSGSGSKTYISKITFTSACDATAPGNISKGTLSAGELTLTAAGSPATNNVWYWQSSATGEAKTMSGTSRTVNAAGTYYIRSLYNNSCWSEAKSITVTATDLVSNYTVKYMDGTTELGSEVVEVGEHPTGSGITTPTKDCYTFAGWDPALNTISGTDGQVINVSATWTARYALSFNFGTTTDLTKDNIASKLDAKNIACSVGTGGSYDSGGTTGYLGYKFKNNGDYITFLVQEGYEAIVTYGYTESGWTVNGASAGVATGTKAYVDKKYQAPTGDGDKLYKLVNQSANSKTSVLTNIVIQEIPAVSNDATLSDLKVGGTTVDGFAANKLDYYVELPYGSTSQPAVTATKHDTKAGAVITQTIASLDDATVTVTAEDGTTINTYTVHFILGPKFGVELIKVATTGGTNKTVTGLYAGDGDVNLSNSTKMDDGKYIGFTLDGTTLQAGDQINVHTTTAANSGGSHVIFYDNMTDKNELYETGEIGDKGNNMFTINAAMVDHATAYVYRSNADAAHKWNGYVDYIAVYRYMAPFIESFEIAGIGALNINGTNITAEVSQDFDVTALTPTIKYWGNGGGAIDKTGAQDFTSPVTYTVSSAYAEDNTGAYAPVTYTVTITKVVPSATPSITTQPASANYYEGATIGALEVVAEASDDGTLTYQWYLGADAIDGATEATYQPTVSEIGSYSYTCVVTNKKDDKPAASVTSNAAVIAIEDDPAAIKLLNGTTVNHIDYITGLSVVDDAIGGVKFSGTVSNVNGVKDLTRVIAYNAKSSKTKIQIKAYNTSTNSRTFVVKGLVEGTTEVEDLASITLGNKETKTTDWIEFNNDDAKNRTIYIFSSSSASDIRFLQVKIIDDGATATKKAGEVGYSLNLNQGRFFGTKETNLAFEGLNAELSSDYTAKNSGVAKLKETSMSFTAAAPVLLKVTTANNKTYYVANSTSGTTNETAKTGESEFNLVAGTWFINAGTSEVQFTKIEFAKPKAAKPVVADMDNVEYCQGSAIDELAVSATVSDGGTMLYQWYKDGEIIAGAEAETYQPTADGEYYVEVVNTKAGYQNSDAVQSNTITVTGYAATVLSGTTGAENWPGTDVTISVTASGKNLHYAWYTCDDAMGTNPVAVDPAVDAAELNVTIAAADTYYKVVVSGDCGDAQEAVITVVARQTVELQDVTGNMTWDFSKANDGSAAGSDLCTDEVLANVHGINNNDDFKSAYLKATANKFKSGKLQASMIKFHTTVDGMITVVFSNTGGKDTERYLTVNGRKTDKGSKNETAVTYTGFVYAGDVELGVVEGDGNMLNFTSVQFTATTSYTRPVNPSFLGTLCWTNNAVLGGATLYVFAGKNENNYLVFDEVEENRLEAGKPYIFMPENGNTEIKLYNTDNEAALTEDQAPVNHMYGTITGKTLVPGVDDNMYYFSSNHIWAVKDFAVNIPVPAYYCYVDYAAVLAAEPAPAPAPGRRRVTMGVKGEQVATGFENLNASERPVKLMINGQMFILRGEKLYDATGRLVK